eukprot:TRINITY_DN6986_c0_g1_i9.p1 TRINITY_DN6986_c0_g1~~TRINITY_DN6986_c0_g1_i9.p1  ORF type:complete len:106 (-),score=7.20 TRINITY_DN6986_c0_g1_i9:130-447(-)
MTVQYPELPNRSFKRMRPSESAVRYVLWRLRRVTLPFSSLNDHFSLVCIFFASVALVVKLLLRYLPSAFLTLLFTVTLSLTDGTITHSWASLDRLTLSEFAETVR